MPILEIDTNALRLNLDRIKSKVKVPICAVVKADAYNHGAVEVARLIWDKVDSFAVANEDEAIELYQSGIRNDILILGETFNGAKLPKNVIPSVSTYESFKQLSARTVRVQVKINTGMNRAGCDALGLERIISEAKYSDIEICGAYSHFYNAERLEEAEKQYDSFFKIISPYKKELNLLHLCASNALILEEKYRLSLVRVGIALYGHGYDGLLPVMKISAEIVWISEVKKGEHISYGDFRANKDMRICALKIGYADGLRRTNFNAQVSIDGKKCPIVGRVCMDITVVDVSQVNCAVGDRAYLLGETISMADFCSYYKVIPHEALTMISKRIKRVYV